MLLIAVAFATPPQSHHTGTLHYRGHGPVPDHVTDIPLTVTVVPDDHGAVVSWAGPDWTDTVYVGEPSWRLKGGTWVPIEDGPDRFALKYLGVRSDLLTRWTQRHPERLKVLAEHTLWATSDSLASMTIDKEGGRLTRPMRHRVFGDVEESIVWTAERVTMDFTETDTRWSATLVDSANMESLDVPAVPARQAIGVEAVDAHTALFEFPDLDSRVLATVHGSAGVVLDAPMSNVHGEVLLDAVRAHFPAVTSWTVVVSHHHPHYTGGLRPWVRSGARLVAHEAIADWVRTLVKVSRLDPDDPAAEEVTIDEVTKTHTLLDGRVTVHAIDEASGHTEAFLATRVLQSDLVYIADLGSWRVGAEAPRIRGTWPAEFRKHPPARVVSGFPVADTRSTWPFPHGRPTRINPTGK